MSGQRGRTAGFYVYALKDPIGIVLYVGKGSGRRLALQTKRHRLDGVILAEFAREKDAFAYERAMIKYHQPELNRSAGGEGGTRRLKARRRQRWEIEIERLGSRVYAARELLKLALPVGGDVRKRLEAVAFGT